MKKLNNLKRVDFEVVEVGYYSIYEPFQVNNKEAPVEVHYAIKIGDDFFHLGQKGLGLHICDYNSSES